MNTQHKYLLRSNQGKEHIESDLDSVDEDKTVLGRDELEVDCVDDWPDLPGSLACREQVILNLVSNGCHAISVDQTQVCEKDSHENGAPEDLINCDLEGNVLAAGSRDLAI